MSLFTALVWGHIAFGAVGLVAFWIPVLGRKGGTAHRKAGFVFVVTMLVTGSLAVGMSVCTLLEPEAHHSAIRDVALIRGIFGWMMLYLGLLTVSLAWHGWTVVRNKANHAANRHPVSVGLQVAVIVAAFNCALQGVLIGQVLMIGMAIVGVASGATNLAFSFNPAPGRIAYQIEHMKALVGAGISVYTAFFAFGAVRTFPSLALNPVLWAIPLAVGLGIIIHHRLRLGRLARPRGPTAMGPAE